MDEWRGNIHAAAARMPAIFRMPDAFPAAEARGEAIECEIDHRRRIERENLAEDQSADDGDSERPAKLRARPAAERQRQSGEAAPPLSSS